MRTKIEEIIAGAAASPEAAKVCSERVLAVIREAAERLREKYHGETTVLGGVMTKMYVLGKCNAMCDMLDLVDGKLGIDLKQPEPFHRGVLCQRGLLRQDVAPRQAESEGEAKGKGIVI